MAETPSSMLPLGTIAPAFKLMDVTKDKQVSLQELKSKIATVIVFICNHCPYVKHIETKLVEVAKKYQAKGISFIAISSNDASKYLEDSPDKMRAQARSFSFSFPYLYDETQEVAKAYHAACTPDLFVFDKKLACVYRGQFDDSRPGNQRPVTGNDLAKALDAILTDKPVDQNQKPSVG